MTKDHHTYCSGCNRLPVECTCPSEDIKPLYDGFWDAYKALRAAWLKTGGGMDLELKIRDPAAEEEFQRRSKCAKRGAEKRRRKYG